jgi:hypothetical protein
MMPDAYLSDLSRRTGLKSLPNLSQIVRLEQTTSKHWPAVEQLARETNPDGFAAWEAANKQAA